MLHLGIFGNAIGMLAGCHGYRAVKSNSLDKVYVHARAHTHTHTSLISRHSNMRTTA